MDIVILILQIGKLSLELNEPVKALMVVNEEALLGPHTVFICLYYSCPWASQVEQWLKKKPCLPM